MEGDSLLILLINHFANILHEFASLESRKAESFRQKQKVFISSKNLNVLNHEKAISASCLGSNARRMCKQSFLKRNAF